MDQKKGMNTQVISTECVKKDEFYKKPFNIEFEDSKKILKN